MIIKLISIPKIIFQRIFCPLRSWILTKLYVDKGKGRIIVKDPFLKIRIKKGRGSIFELNGILKIEPYICGNAPVNIVLSSNSQLIINGNFDIGHGVTISLGSNSKLLIGGALAESSGITCNTLILVYKHVEIGKDFICAWDVTITDSDWHTIVGTEYFKSVTIGDHVWIAQKSCILKGSEIGNNCIIAACSKVTNKKYPDNVLIAGTTGGVVKENISWKR